MIALHCLWLQAFGERGKSLSRGLFVPCIRCERATPWLLSNELGFGLHCAGRRTSQSAEELFINRESKQALNHGMHESIWLIYFTEDCSASAAESKFLKNWSMLYIVFRTTVTGSYAQLYIWHLSDGNPLCSCNCVLSLRSYRYIWHNDCSSLSLIAIHNHCLPKAISSLTLKLSSIFYLL